MTGSQEILSDQNGMKLCRFEYSSIIMVRGNVFRINLTKLNHFIRIAFKIDITHRYTHGAELVGFELYWNTYIYIGFEYILLYTEKST